ncbi:uncharacterized protein PHACADRAFT_203454 [Phanerochaete carnosa HHB-10118-sp]|uniref:Cyanovirin-N domain-containing protein n=1 Tax=Phanerochaete carnosa (strain HHB-10118-sp) TaxID=650164 RepID=K5WL90_PHACS|nr:uncharacterized protein PHACADRAFT_203454 [Phanerochaete carnosa HHB-10118-sp]EKM60195.1 hypothetical protein PHACADRAFT_203454 [Phanerochaete carnosa HHB-10118-sp]
MHVLRVVFSLALLLSSALAVAVPSVPYCQNPRALNTTYIGRNNDVLVRRIACDNVPTPQFARAIETRQSTSACGEPTTTNCFTPAGGGPDPNDCQIIAEALSFDSQNAVDGDAFSLAPSGSDAVLTLTFNSCESFIVNQAGAPLTYCRSDWSSAVNNLAFNCQATQNAHGGNAVANDQSFFIQYVPLCRFLGYRDF